MNQNALAEKPVVTYSLIGINVLVFLLETFSGGSEQVSTAVHFGALYLPLLTENGEWWRFFTSMFLHFGIYHLGSNMLALFALGPNVEMVYGKSRFLMIYFFSGICGSLLTILTEFLFGNYGVSAGASGAIFGLLGTYLVFALNPNPRRIFPLRRVLLSIVVSLSPALTDPSISLTAHVGGLLGGTLMSFLLLPRRLGGKLAS